MYSADDIIRSHEPEAAWSDGEPSEMCFRPAVVKQILDELHVAGCVIWGVDAFILHPDGSHQTNYSHDCAVHGAMPAADRLQVLSSHVMRFVGTDYVFLIVAEDAPGFREG